MVDELLKRFGTDPESAERLAAQAAAAQAVLGIHGVYVSARDTSAPCGLAPRAVVQTAFPVHDTPSRRDPLHRTVGFPVPVTAEVAERFNRLFGRS